MLKGIMERNKAERVAKAAYEKAANWVNIPLVCTGLAIVVTVILNSGCTSSSLYQI